MKKIAIFLIGVLCLTSCGNSSSSRYNSESSSFDHSESSYDEDEGDVDDEEQSSQQVVCPMCGGTGVFEYMPGDVMAPRQTCSGCNGNKFVTPEQARQITEAMNQVNSAIGGNPVGNQGGGGKSVSQLESELRKAYELLSGMEADRDMCTSVTLRPQYDRMIVEQKQRIADLEAQLRNASY